MAEKKSSKTTDVIRELALPVCKSLGLSLWDVRYEKEGATWYLRVLIDKEEGLDMDSCEEFSRQFNEILDECDPIAESYVFEAGSPGLGRELRTPEHFEAYIGEMVRIKLYKAINGEKELSAKLVSYDKEEKKITVLADGKLTLALSECAFVKADDEDLF
ncbi:MAG: ribosome maturation factor RimP [Ruminococcus sp.]|nr:ribosome maturation factor RimP [Ruminococcus sp.]